MPLRLCLEDGCNERTTTSRCPYHHRLWVTYRRRWATGSRGSTYSWRKARRMAMARDRYHCTVCTKTTDLEVHHRNGCADDNRLSNLVTLCSVCHAGQH